jgi:predicted DNA-binding protein (MmcQ/YjbR family)
MIATRSLRAPGKLTEKEVLEKLRPLCLALPDATETVMFGHPTFQVYQKTFCVVEEYQGELSICVKVGKENQAAFLRDPRFYRTPYVGRHGWVSLKVNAAPVNWKEVAQLVEQSYKAVLSKPKRKRS